MKTTWNLKQLYTSPSDPQIQKDISKSKKVISSFSKKWSKDTSYLKSISKLKQALDDYNQIGEEIGICDKPLLYLYLQNQLDQTDARIKGQLNLLEETVTKLQNKIEFFTINISKIERQQQKKFLRAKILSDYKHFLERMFKFGKYTLSVNEEKIFNLISKTSHDNWVNMISELLDKQELKVISEEGRKTDINYNEVQRYLNSRNKKVRDYAAEEFNKVNERYAEIAEFEINTILESKKIQDQYRGVKKPDELRHLSSDIDSRVVETLNRVVTENFDISQRYYQLKAKLLKQKKLGYHERNVPLGKEDTKYSYKESLNIVKRTFKNLDPQFCDIVNFFEKNGLYDVFPKRGKSGGAYCLTMSKSLPPFILLNHKERLNDVLTIAHESGHGIHSMMSNIQNSLSSGHPISLAETASTFFEGFVFEEIEKELDMKSLPTVLAEKLNDDISTIFRQVACYNFEKELHKEFRKKGYLKKEEISKIFCKHMHSYLGDSVKQDQGMQYGWIYWSHIRNFFYVYSYASGLLISKALQNMVKKDKKKVSLVKKFLSSGFCKSPEELFKGMGIDISKKKIWEMGIDSVESDLDKLNSVAK